MFCIVLKSAEFTGGLVDITFEFVLKFIFEGGDWAFVANKFCIVWYYEVFSLDAGIP
jgi:hypothetical protein